MTQREMEQKIAKLQSMLDQYETEMSYLHRILLDCGFSKGIVTLKATVESMIHGGQREAIDEFDF